MKYASITASDIYEDLCVKIRKLELEPGMRISENEMAATYNVSRSTVRSAFSKLEQNNLIEIYPQIGTFISAFDMDYIYNGLYVRNLVEMDVLENVIKLEDKTELIEKLEINLKAQQKSRGQLYYDHEFEENDHEFHQTILESINKKDIMDIIRDSYNHIARWRNFDIRSRQRLNMLIDEHEILVEAIKTNDVKMAKETMTKHLLNISSDFLDQAKQMHPNYFSK